MRRRAAAAFVFALCLAFAPVPRPRTPRLSDAERLQGEWVRVAYRVSGRPVKSAEITMVIDGDRLGYDAKPGVICWRVRLDEKADPRVFDREWNAPGALFAETVRGVYSLNGDTLTVCCVYGSSGRDRPTDIKGSANGQIVEVYRRKKP